MNLMVDVSSRRETAATGPAVILHIHDGDTTPDISTIILHDRAWPEPRYRPRRVLQAATLRETVSILKYDSVDAILLNLRLRREVGLDVCARLLEDFPSIPVIILVPEEDLPDAIEAVRLGAQDFVIEENADAATLWRALTFGVERKANREALSRALVEKEKAQRAAERERANAQRAGRAKSDFLAMIGHEFRTPLNGIIGFAATLEQLGPDENVRTAATAIRESGNRISTMVGDILDLLSLRSGTLHLTPTTMDVPDMVREVADEWSPLAEEKGLSTTWEVEPTTSKPVSADRIRIAQVLSHLVGNAVKFTAAGGVEMRVAVSKSSDHALNLRCDVIDTGPGLPEDLATHMSTYFDNTDLPDMPHGAGLGIGLPLAKELVTLMGGRLHLGSGVEGGAHVWFSVPVQNAVLADGADPSQTAAGPRKEKSRAAEPHWRRLLVVEDTPINRRVFEVILDQTAYQYDFAENGVSALELADQRRYDLILMDIQMPDLDGVEVARRIRAVSDLNGKTPIVAVTAHGVAGDRVRYLAAGMDDYLPKPITPHSLLSAIERNTAGVSPYAAPSAVG